jgi:hypothetical protein
MSARCVRTWCVRQNDRSPVATRPSYCYCSVSPRRPHRRAVTSQEHRCGTAGRLHSLFLLLYYIPLQGVLLGSSWFQACLSVLEKRVINSRPESDFTFQGSKEMTLNPIEHFGNYIVAYLLKARTVEPEKQPLLCNSCVTRNSELNVGSGFFCAVRADAV